MRYTTKTERILNIGKKTLGIFSITLIGIGGIVLGGYLVIRFLIYINREVLHWGNLGIAILGSILLLLIWSWIVAISTDEG